MTNPEQSSNQTDEEMEIDLRQLLQIIKKRSKLIIAGTLLCALSAGIISFVILTPIYMTKTLLMVTQATDKLQNYRPVNNGEGLEDVVSNVSRMPVWTMNTYAEQIKSEAMMNRIIDRMGLENYSAGRLASMISTNIVKDSNLIEVRVSSGDPVLAAQIANTLSSEYLRFMTEKNQEKMSSSVSFLEEQKEITEQELRLAQEDLQHFQSQPRGVAILEAEFNNKTKDLAKFNSLYKMVGVETQQLSYEIVHIEQEQVAIEEKINLENQQGGSVVSVKEQNPIYLSLQQKLADKRSSLAGKQGESERLKCLLYSIKRDLNILQADLAEKRIIEEKLQTEVERLQKTVETLAEKVTETQIARAMDVGDNSVVVLSEASIPGGSVQPNEKLNITIALILGLMIFTFLAFVLEYLDNTLKTSEDVNRELALPVLSIIPMPTKKNMRYNSYGG